MIEVLLDHGMGDALSTRAFLFEYCRQKNIPHSDIIIYAGRHEVLFENDNFVMRDISKAPKNLNWFDSFAKFSFQKNYRNHIQRDLMISRNAGINFSWQHKEPLNWTCPDINNLNLPEKFVTVNYGFDHTAIPNHICAKMWSMKYWEELVKKIGVRCIQIGGGKNTKEIKGVYLSFLNKINIKESAEIMKRALFHIDTEGGLPILNHHLGGKSAVLFGATAIQTFGFKENLNIVNNTCRNSPCDPRQIKGGNVGIYQQTNHLQCDLRCMKELKPDYVIDQIYKNKWLT